MADEERRAEKAIEVSDSTLANPLQLTQLQRAMGYVGWGCTFLAMGAQAGFSVALMDQKFFYLWHPAARIPAGMVIAVTSEESKRRVVTAHNEQAFQNFATWRWVRDFDPRTWTAKGVAWNVVKIPLSYGGVVAFVAITGLSLDSPNGAAGIFYSYDIHAFTVLANILNSRACQFVFMLAGLATNIAFYPEVTDMGMHAIIDWASSPFESPEYRACREHVIAKIEALRVELKKAYERGDTATFDQLAGKANSFLAAVWTLMLNEDSTPRLADDITALIPTHALPKVPQRDSERFKMTFLGMIAAMVGCIGFYNIFGMGPLATLKVSQIFFGSDDGWFTQLEPANQWLGYLAMITMSTGVIPHFGYELLRCRLWANEDSQHIKVSSTFGLVMNFSLALLITGLGILPNVYQALVLLSLTKWLVTFSGLGSAFLEGRAAREACNPMFKQESHWSNAKRYMVCCCVSSCCSAEDKTWERGKSAEFLDKQLIDMQNTPAVVHALTRRAGLFKSRFSAPTEDRIPLRLAEQQGASTTPVHNNANIV
ncbi:MAG: hypothetical protein DHS20C10_07460 [marine bacterium B5-7]|nr:MAG: hypothetical protein DHS20C10_07460 [marine bacterium B5-7]